MVWQWRRWQRARNDEMTAMADNHREGLGGADDTRGGGGSSSNDDKN
jgi:hypothetical protein